MPFVLSSVILNRACDSTNNVFEDSFDEHSSEAIEIVLGLFFADSLGQILFSGSHILENSPDEELLRNTLSWQLSSFNAISIPVGLLNFKVFQLQLFPPFGHNLDLVVDVINPLLSGILSIFIRLGFSCANAVLSCELLVRNLVVSLLDLHSFSMRSRGCLSLLQSYRLSKKR